MTRSWINQLLNESVEWIIQYPLIIVTWLNSDTYWCKDVTCRKSHYKFPLKNQPDKKGEFSCYLVWLRLKCNELEFTSRNVILIHTESFIQRASQAIEPTMANSVNWIREVKCRKEEKDNFFIISVVLFVTVCVFVLCDSSMFIICIMLNTDYLLVSLELCTVTGNFCVNT